MPGADPSSFEIFCIENYNRNPYSHLFARDDMRVYSKEGYMMDGIDRQSFVPIGLSFTWGVGYVKDKLHAYWITDQNWGSIPTADVKTFATNITILPYAKDFKHVYYGNKGIIKDADPETFSRIGNSDYFKDKSRVFYLSNLMPSEVSSVETFEPFPSVVVKNENRPSVYGRDGENIYCFGLVMDGVDHSSFRQDYPTYREATDKNFIYTPCEPYDPENP